MQRDFIRCFHSGITFVMCEASRAGCFLVWKNSFILTAKLCIFLFIASEKPFYRYDKTPIMPFWPIGFYSRLEGMTGKEDKYSVCFGVGVLFCVSCISGGRWCPNLGLHHLYPPQEVTSVIKPLSLFQNYQNRYSGQYRRCYRLFIFYWWFLLCFLPRIAPYERLNSFQVFQYTPVINNGLNRLIFRYRLN